MRQERIIQASIFDMFGSHEIGRELEAMSSRLDQHRAVLRWWRMICDAKGSRIPDAKAGFSLGERLLAAINEQLDAKGLVLKRGTLIDASIVTSAARPPKSDENGGVGEVSPVDPDAGFTKKNGKTFFGYKAHAGVDEGSGLIRQAFMTTASIHDSQAGDALVQGDEGAVYADKAYDDEARRARLKAAGIKAYILYKARRQTQQAASPLAKGLQQGGLGDPGAGGAAVRGDEGTLRLRPLPCFRPRTQRRPPSAVRRRRQSQNSLRPDLMSDFRPELCPDHVNPRRIDPM